MSKSFPVDLPAERVELEFADKKPLWSRAEAQAEAERCLYCSDAPCIKACPTEIDIPTFIKKIATSNLRGSARTIFEQNILGYACSRVCPVEVLCEGACVYTGWQKAPIRIGRLQRYATENATHALSEPMFSPKAPTGRKVALIGAGPASLACAAELRREGHAAVIFEKRTFPGGLNTTGVAPYKLHANDALLEIDWILKLGIEIQTGIEIGKNRSGADLLSQFDAVFIGIGLGADNRLEIEGEDGSGVVGATDWIEQIKVTTGGQRSLGRVAVVGGGNTAIDVARECAQLHAEEVMMIYRRGAVDMSGYEHELEAAKKEGVRLVLETQPVAVIRDKSGHVQGLRVARTKNGAAVSGTEKEIACDLVVVAIGQSKIARVAKQFSGVATDKRGCILVDAKTWLTGNSKVYAGGDCVNGGKEVVNAVAEGRDAARAMHALWGAR